MPSSRPSADLSGLRLSPSLVLVRPFGSSSHVWLGEHGALNTEVVVRVVPGLVPGDVDRFQRDIAVAAKLKSPHVVQIFDHGVHDGSPYVVMELLEGEDLGRRLAREGRLGSDETRLLIRQVGKALAVVHQAGMRHGDLSPSNVFLTRVVGETFVKVLGIGVAASRAESSHAPHYEAPERVLEQSTVGSDLWSLAVIAYRCLTGRLPFEGTSASTVRGEIETGTLAAPSAGESDLPPAVNAFFSRALQHDPALRFVAAMDLVVALDEALAPSIGSGSKEPVAGDIIADKYRVEGVLGRGGMGVVLAARHVLLDEPVAVKLIAHDGRLHADALARFFREGKAAAKIRSEHVAKVLDVGSMADGTAYLVLEHLDGRDLSAILEREGPLSPERAVRHVLEACEALAEAHARGIVHRDVKPGNLFVAERVDGTTCTKVLDFGVAKVGGALRGEAGLTTDTRAVIGSPYFMSPEQLRTGKNVDGRADIWSLGVTLHQLVTGRLPFRGESFGELCGAILQDEPERASAVKKGIPSALDAVLLRCLAKSPDDRYATVEDLARDLVPLAGPGAAIHLERIGRVRASLASPDGPRDALPSLPESPAAATSAAAPSRTSTTWHSAAPPPMAGPSPRTSPRVVWVAGAAVALAVGAMAFFAFRAPSVAPVTAPPSAAVVPDVAPRDATSAAAPASATPAVSSSAPATSASPPIASSPPVELPRKIGGPKRPPPSTGKPPPPQELFGDTKN